METYTKDPALTGIYVKRCKCGARPYLDRVMIGSIPKWLKCDICGKTSKSDCDKQTAIDNWNNDIVDHIY